MSISQRSIFTSGGTAVQVEIPAGAANGGAVVMAYGSDGMDEPWGTMILAYAELLAGEGFVTLRPDYLASTHTTPGPGVFPLIATLRPAWMKALSETIDCVNPTSLPLVDPARIGLLGFSLGGHLALQLRRRARVLVELFAPWFDGIGTPGKLTHAQIHHGAEDKLPPTEVGSATKIETQLKAELTDTDLHIYEHAGHGFVSENSLPDTAKARRLMAVLGGTNDGNEKARKESQQATISFFRTHLGS